MKIVVGGQVDKEAVKEIILKHVAGDVRVEVMDDVSAAMKIKNNEADYYFGACLTGGGGALAMAIAILGMNLCESVATPGGILSNDEIIESIKAGARAFGFTIQAAETVIPVIINEITK